MSDPGLPNVPDLMRHWRMRIDPREIPAAVGLPEDRLARGLTVGLAAELLGVTERHYRRIEKGSAHGVSLGLVTRIVELLALSSWEAEILYAWCGHRAPAKARPESAKIPSYLLKILHAEEHGAYWCTNLYEVMAVNPRGAANWPWLREGTNVLDSLLTGEGREQCREWESRWAPPLLAQLRRELFNGGENPGLEALLRRVCRDPEVARIWRSTADVQPRFHGTARPMVMPPWGPAPVQITVSALVPIVRPDLRLVCGVPDESVTPQLPPVGALGAPAPSTEREGLDKP